VIVDFSPVPFSKHFCYDSPIRKFLRKTEISDFEMALTVQEKILRLEIPINYVLTVQVIQSTNYFGRIETTCGPSESAGRS